MIPGAVSRIVRYVKNSTTVSVADVTPAMEVPRQKSFLVGFLQKLEHATYDFATLPAERAQVLIVHDRSKGE